MRARLLLSPAISLLGATIALITAPGATARPPTSHRVKLVGEIETLSSTGTIAVPGTKDTDAGILDGTIAGSPRFSGALRQVVTWLPALAISAKGTAFGATGSFRFTLAGRFTVRSAGRLALTGTLAVNGGTGHYEHARGTLRVTGIASASAGTARSTFDLAGALSYGTSGGAR